LPTNWEGGPFRSSAHIGAWVVGAFFLFVFAAIMTIVFVPVGLALWLALGYLIWTKAKGNGLGPKGKRYLITSKRALVVDKLGQVSGECDLCDPKSRPTVVITNVREIPERYGYGQNTLSKTHHVGNVNFMKNGVVVLTFTEVEHPEGPRDMAAEIVNNFHHQLNP